MNKDKKYRITEKFGLTIFFLGNMTTLGLSINKTFYYEDLKFIICAIIILFGALIYIFPDIII